MKSQAKRSAKTQAALALYLLIGLFLAFTTYGVLQLLHDSSHNAIFGWLNLSGIGVGVSVMEMAILLLVIGADIFWVLLFAIWLLRRKLHIEPTDKTLRLP